MSSSPSSSSTTSSHQQLIEAAHALHDFNERSDVLIETMQPLLAEYCEVLKALRQEVVRVNMRAMNCVDRAKRLAEKEGVDLSKLKLGQHQEELDREEKAELK